MVDYRTQVGDIKPVTGYPRGMPTGGVKYDDPMADIWMGMPPEGRIGQPISEPAYGINPPTPVTGYPRRRPPQQAQGQTIQRALQMLRLRGGRGIGQYGQPGAMSPIEYALALLRQRMGMRGGY